MKVRDMKVQIPCTMCKSFKKHRFDLCSSRDRCPILIGPQLVLQHTTDEEFEKFSSGIRKV